MTPSTRTSNPLLYWFSISFLSPSSVGRVERRRVLLFVAFSTAPFPESFWGGNRVRRHRLPHLLLSRESHCYKSDCSSTNERISLSLFLSFVLSIWNSIFVGFCATLEGGKTREHTVFPALSSSLCAELDDMCVTRRSTSLNEVDALIFEHLFYQVENR